MAGRTAHKRGHGEGSITKRGDGRWMARTVVDGRRRSAYGKTREEAARGLRKLQHARDDGMPIPDGRETLAHFTTAWLASEKIRLRSTTYLRYEQYMRVHVIPHIGRVPLGKLTPQHLQRLYDRLVAGGLSTTSAHHVHAVIHKALEQAMRWNKVPRNVAELVDAPKIRRVEMRTLSVVQAKQLLTAADGDRFEALYVLALSTGMRQGELLALKWSDISLGRGTLQVRGTLHQLAGKFQVEEPKTKSSRRLVQLTGVAVEALRRHRKTQNEERLASGADWEDNDIVFANEAGRFVDARNLMRRSYRPLLRRAQLPEIRFHDLRHTAATLLLEQGTHAKYVSEMLGHSSIAITLDLYSHVTPAMHQQAADVMDGILRR